MHIEKKMDVSFFQQVRLLPHLYLLHLDIQPRYPERMFDLFLFTWRLPTILTAVFTFGWAETMFSCVLC